MPKPTQPKKSQANTSGSDPLIDPASVTGEFTAYCNYYYELTVQLAKRQERFKTLLDNAPLYSGETLLTDIDAIIAYYRETQAQKANVDETMEEILKTERTILMIMQHFEIPFGRILTGVIPGLVEYQVWADDTDAIHLRKTKDLEPEKVPDNVIRITFSGMEDWD